MENEDKNTTTGEDNNTENRKKDSEDKMIMEIMGTRLKNLRKNKKMKQHDLCEKLEINASTYSSYEIGRIKIPYNLLVKFCELYSVSADYLLGITDDDSHIIRSSLNSPAEWLMPTKSKNYSGDFSSYGSNMRNKSVDNEPDMYLAEFETNYLERGDLSVDGYLEKIKDECGALEPSEQNDFIVSFFKKTQVPADSAIQLLLNFLHGDSEETKATKSNESPKPIIQVIREFCTKQQTLRRMSYLRDVLDEIKMEKTSQKES
jgi:transcriptional regulator with XRE-family HTH domain